MAKRFKKILVLAVIFTMTLVNYGLPLQAIASEGESLFNFAFFRKNEIALDAYFGEDSDDIEEVKNVNDTAKITLEVSPLIEGYLKSGSLKFNLKNGNDNNFKLESVTLEQKEKLELDEVDTLMLEEKEAEKDAEKEKSSVENEISESESVEEKLDEENTVSEDVESKEEKTENKVESKEFSVRDLFNIETDEEEVSDAEVGEESQEVVPETVVSEDSEKVEDVEIEKQEELSEIESEDKEDKEDKESDELSEEEIIKQARESYEVSLASDNEIALKNIIDSTKIFVEVSYKQSESIKPEDLFGEIEIVLEGNYINKKLETLDITRKQELNLGWEYSKEIEVTSDFAKVSPFTVGKNSGTIIENIITITRNVEENNFLPIKQTNIKIEIPKINDKLPIAVNVAANKLMATLGKELTGKEFTKDNWLYDEETGILEISVSNNDMLAGNGEDKFDIICRYEDYYEEEKIDLNKKLLVQVEEYSSNENKIQEKEIDEIQEKEVIAGELMSYAAIENDGIIGKGKINANYHIDAGDTSFSSMINVTVLTSDILDEVLIEPVREVYKNKENVEFDASSDIMYSGVRFNFAEIKEMLAQGSTIDLLDGEGNVFHTITKDVDATKIEFANKIDTVKVKINDVKVNGNLSIEFVKSINNCQYSAAEFAGFEKIENIYKAEVKYVGFEDIFQLSEVKDELEFSDTITQVNLLMSNTSLSTIYENENIEFKIDLINNLETSDIYKNPSFELVFPSYIKEVKINNIYTLYQNGLSIRDYQVVNENGINKIVVNLDGVQNGFNFSNITNGTNIIINTNLVVDEITPQKQDEVRLYYCNEAVTNYQTQSGWNILRPMVEGILSDKNGYDSTTFEYQAPSGMHAINAIINYDGTGQEIKSFNQGEIIQTIPIKGESYIATMELSVLNNTGNDCTDVALLGRIPFKGNKDLETGEDLGTNIDILMKSFITANEGNSNSATVYYSTNPNADKDLNNEANGWMSEVTGDRDAVKSFMIVIDGELKQGGILKYRYDFEIPANLGYEVKILGTFGVLYNNSSNQEMSVADKVGLITESGAKINATMSVDIGDGAEVGEARYLKYKVKVENIGSIDLSNVVIENIRPNHIWFCEISQNIDSGNDSYEKVNKSIFTTTIPELKVGEVVEKEIVAKAKEIPENFDEYFSSVSNVDYDEEKGQYFEVTENNEIKYITELPEEFFITNYATVYVDGTVKGFETNTVRNKLVHSNFDIETTLYKSVERLEAGTKFEYVIDVENISGEKISNIVIEDILPKELKFLELDKRFDVVDVEYDEKTNKVELKVGELENRESVRIYLCCSIDNLKNVAEANIANYFTVKADDIEERSSIVERKAYGAEFFITQEIRSEQDNLYEYEKFQLVINLRNIGKADSKDIKFDINVPNGIQILSINTESDYPIPTDKTENKVTGRVATLETNSEISFIVNLRSDVFGDGEQNRKFEIQSKVMESYIGEISSENLELVILDNPNREMTNEEKKQEEDKNIVVNPETNVEQNENKNVNTNKDKEDTNTQNEPTVQVQQENVQKIETYKISGKVWDDANKNNAKDSDEEGISKVNVLLYEGNIQIKSVLTDSLGKYSFTELPAGNYSVVFNYDKAQYVAAKYKLNNVVEKENSDAVEADEGMAVTEVINLRDKDVEINLGLQSRDELDISVQKYISKAIVNTRGKEKVEIYNNDTLAKLEIKSKELAKTKIQLEYRIVVTNLGDVNGTVGMVYDYLPESLTFDSKQNQNWYMTSDGILCNESLNKEIIKPGESRELKLVLNKVMTNDNTGTISNKVQIDKVSTDKSLKDNLENNIATQEMIITVSTGRTISIVIMIVMLIMATVLVYGIKTGKIKKAYK